VISLSAALPLRPTTVWGGFAVAGVVPHRYGATEGRLIQYEPTGRVWCWADHVCDAIDSVTVGGQPAGEWQWRNTLDSSGHAVALVEFGQQQDVTADIVAGGRGKLDAATGQLMQSPADILFDVLAGIAGIALGREMLADFRADCAARGLTCAGSIDAADTAQTIARAICASVGAVFCGVSAPVARLWPGGALPAASVRVAAGADVSASSSAEDLCTDVTVNFDFADGAARAAIQLDAPDAIARYGRRANGIDAPWITEPRIAYDVAMRLLQQRARPQWRVSAAGLRARIAPGSVASLDHPALPVSGDCLVLSTDCDLLAGTSSIQCMVPVGDTPVVRLVRQSRRYEPQVFAAAAVQTVGSDRVLTLQDEDGSPIVGAAVALDNNFVRTSDAAGRVAFPANIMPPGQHVLSIQTLDGRHLETTVLVQ
jgi:hypothetical protein